VKTNDLKLKLYPAVIAILGLSLIALLMSRVEIQVSRNDGIDPTIPVEEVPTIDEVPTAPSAETDPSPVPPLVEPTATPSPLPSPAPNTALGENPGQPAPLATSEGGLRVSNQSRYPVRVALLPQQPSTQAPTAPAANPSVDYNQPVHWDFAPEEGRSKGLILSLPDAKLRLYPGDVLVAFAQDGSRRYWGPYVVGKTPSPVWSAEQKEWVLILQP
jgi:hypothetical protein